MSASIGEIAGQPIAQDIARVPHAHPLAPEPSGPSASASAAAVTGGDSTTSTANADGSITTVVTDALGNTASISTNAPAPRTGAAGHPLVSFEA